MASTCISILGPQIWGSGSISTASWKAGRSGPPWRHRACILGDLRVPPCKQAALPLQWHWHRAARSEWRFARRMGVLGTFHFSTSFPSALLIFRWRSRGGMAGGEPGAQHCYWKCQRAQHLGWDTDLSGGGLLAQEGCVLLRLLPRCVKVILLFKDWGKDFRNH